MITIDELRIYLKLNGIDESQYTDKDIEHLIKYYTKLFNSLICFSYKTKTYNDYYPMDIYDVFDSLLIYNRPIKKITNVTLDDDDCTDKISYIDMKSGIIYFTEGVQGNVKVDYIAGWNDEDIKNIIIPIIIDLIIYGIKYGREGRIASLTEGDVSITYSTETELLDINDRIKNLNKRFCTKARML